MAVQRDDIVIDPATATHVAVGARVSWSGIFGGAVVGIGVLLLLAALGVAIGITAIDPANPDGGTIGTGAAIWTGVSLLIALFIGGWSAARMSMLWDRTAALFQGTLVWALSMVAILWLAASGVGLVAGPVFGMAGTMAQSVGAAVGAGGGDLAALGRGDAEQILQRLQDPKTAQTLSAATGMSQQEAQQTLGDLRGRIEAARNDPARVTEEMKRALSDFGDRAKAQVQQTAQAAQPGAARTAWYTFGGLVLGLLAGMIGAAAGRRNAATRAAEVGGGYRAQTS